MKYLILIGGKKRSGKDFTKDFMVDNFGGGSVSYADPIKQIIAKTFGITVEELDYYKNEEEKLYTLKKKNKDKDKDDYYHQPIINFREILQNFGTDAMKPFFGNNVWAIKAIEQANALNKDIIVIPDFRFIEEYTVALEESKKSNFKLVTIKIVNDDIKDEDSHSSEKELEESGFEFDYIIDNTGRPNISPKISEVFESIIS